MSNELRRALFPWYDQNQIQIQKERTEVNNERMTKVRSAAEEVAVKAELFATLVSSSPKLTAA